MNLALRAVTRPGDVVAVESPTYFGILQAIEALGLSAIEVPTHAQTSVDLELLDRAIRKHRARAAIVMTTSHNPLGCVMSDAAKQALVDLVTRRNVALVEDDVYGDLASTAHGHALPRPSTPRASCSCAARSRRRSRRAFAWAGSRPVAIGWGRSWSRA